MRRDSACPVRIRRVILPLTVLRRLDCVIAPVKPDMLARYDEVQGAVEN